MEFNSIRLRNPLPRLVLLLLLLTSGKAGAQRAAGTNADIDPLFLIDVPVAGILPATSGSIETFIYPDGGLLVGAIYGPARNVNGGVFFGATRAIGSGGVIWNKWPGVMIRYRVFEENTVYPAIVVGFDSQGRDGYKPQDGQYAVKSPGFFVCASKNYALAGTISFHGGANYSLERYDADYNPNAYLGVEKSIGRLVSVLGEYNFAFDNDKGKTGFWNGSLNIGVRIATNIGFNLDLHLKNLLTTNCYYPNPIRALRLQYVRYF
jgi:hypothetical protein